MEEVLPTAIALFVDIDVLQLWLLVKRHEVLRGHPGVHRGLAADLLRLHRLQVGLGLADSAEKMVDLHNLFLRVHGHVEVLDVHGRQIVEVLLRLYGEFIGLVLVACR